MYWRAGDIGMMHNTTKHKNRSFKFPSPYLQSFPFFEIFWNFFDVKWKLYCFNEQIRKDQVATKSIWCGLGLPGLLRVIKKQPKKYPTQLPKQLHTLFGCRVSNALYNFLVVPSNETRLKLSCYGFIGQTWGEAESLKQFRRSTFYTLVEKYGVCLNEWRETWSNDGWSKSHLIKTTFDRSDIWSKQRLLETTLDENDIWSKRYLIETTFARNDTFIYLFIFYFISIFILLTCRKAMEALIHRVNNYPDLLPEMPRYCCPLVI